MKKLFYYLSKLDGIWSVPLAFLAFWLVGVILTGIFGFYTGTYDLGFIQPLFLAAAIVIGATNIAVQGLYFTLRSIYRYIYGKKQPGAAVVNHSKKDWDAITPIQRILVSLFVFFFFIAMIVIVYLKFV